MDTSNLEQYVDGVQLKELLILQLQIQIEMLPLIELGDSYLLLKEGLLIFTIWVNQLLWLVVTTL